MEEKRDFSALLIILVLMLLGGIMTYQNNMLSKQLKAQSELLEQYHVSASMNERFYESQKTEIREALINIVEYVQAIENLGVKQAEYKRSLELKSE